MTKLNELELTYYKTVKAADEEEAANREIIKDFIQGLTGSKLNVRASVRNDKDININVDFVEPSGKDCFGAGFEMYYRSDYDFDSHSNKEPELSMNCGTCGSYTRAKRPFYVERCHLMSTIWNKENELVELFKSLSFKYAELTRAARRAYETEQDRIKQQEEDDLRLKVLETVKPGNIFTEDIYLSTWNSETCKYEHKLDHTRTVKIVKITPKRVYLEWSYKTENEKDYVHKWTNGKYVYAGYNTGYINRRKSGYIKYETFIWYRQQQLKGDKNSVTDMCDGTTQLEYKFVKTGFIPNEEND